MHLTPDILAATYDYMRSTAPFNKWRLPESDEVEFFVKNDRKEFGSYEYDFEKKQLHRINVSSAMHGNHAILRMTMAHEMTHLHQRISGFKARYHSASHGPTFKRIAAQVCKAHGFDLKTF